MTARVPNDVRCAAGGGWAFYEGTSADRILVGSPKPTHEGETNYRCPACGAVTRVPILGPALHFGPHPVFPWRDLDEEP